MKRTALLLLFTTLLSMFAWADNTYKDGKIVKWENGTYATGSKKHPTNNWVVYQLQGADNSTYSIARKKETKPEMQAGDAVQYEMKKSNEITVIRAYGKKQTYQIVGQTAAPRGPAQVRAVGSSAFGLSANSSPRKRRTLSLRLRPAGNAPGRRW